MHSIVKNISKVLALSVLSTIFSPSFVWATNPIHNPKAQTTEVKPIKNYFKTLFDREIERFGQLGKLGQCYYFKVENSFYTQGNYEVAYLLLKQLNDLFDKYPKFLSAFIYYCRTSGHFFTLKKAVPIRKAVSTGGTIFVNGFLSFDILEMSLYIPPTGYDIGFSPRNGLDVPIDEDKYFQAISAHEFGHLMSFLKCIIDYCVSYCAIKHTPIIILPDQAELIGMYNEHSQKIRNAIALKLGYAPYISHYANKAISLDVTELPLPLKPGEELTRVAVDKVDREYFAELFAYTECNSTAPENLKTALHEIIDKWFF